jgi:hypothetical protein
MGETRQHAERLTPRNAAPKHALFEPVVLLLLAPATVGTAWCSLQVAVCGGVLQRTTNISDASIRRAVTDSTSVRR